MQLSALGVEPVTTAAAVGVAANVVKGLLGGKKKKSAGGSAASSSQIPNITVSPAIQTRISPQISPVFSQIQDSAGASTYGAPSMTSTGAQSADTGQRLPGGVPRGTRQYPYSPFDEYGRSRTPQPYPSMPVISKMGGYGDLIKWGIIGFVAMTAIKSFSKPSYSVPKYGPKTVTGKRLV